jgi:hypothetical protein
MNTTTSLPRRFEFCYPQLDALVEVQERDDEVVIRATRDVFTEAQKVAFVRHLASEGFIADRFRWCPAISSPANASVRWSVDYSWLEISPAVRATARRFVARLFVGMTALWLLLMWVFVVHPAG